MSKPLPFFNWSLKKAQETEPESFMRARILIVFTILLFSILKCLIVVGVSFHYGLGMQMPRAIAALVFYILFLKLLLYKPASLNTLAHIVIAAGILVVASNIFIYTHSINLITVQFIFMILLSGFYTLGATWGIVYSAFSILPVVIFLIFKGNANIYFSSTPQELPSPAFEFIAVLNFISISVTHFLFYRAFHLNLKEKEKLNEQLQASVAGANKLAMARSNFLSTISHELRTPLNSVIGISELLIEDKPEERQMENLKVLHLSSLDLLSLINNVLDFNKMDSGKLVLENVPFRLDEFMRNICSALRIKASGKGLHFGLEIDQQLEKTVVISDPTRLSQVIYNLAGNAIKFTSEGGISVKLGCIKKTGASAEILFSVSDTGMGIHPDRQESIFELFTQEAPDVSRKYGGTGLGLAIVRQILALFHSSIQVESSPGKGARFFFTVSFGIAPEIAAAKIAQPASDGIYAGLKVLVAEDNEVNRFLLTKQLDKLGLNAVIVENGKLAYEACLSQYFDVILLDLQMPVSDGYETIERIRAIDDPAKSGVLIFAFTASVTEEEKIRSSGFDGFLYKPVNMNDLKEKLGQSALLNRTSKEN